MTDSPSVVIHFRELDHDEIVRDSIEKQGRRLADEFHEISRVEISLEANGAGFIAHGHVTGKGTDAVTHAEATEVGPAADLVFGKLARQLRKVHDKRIFSQRREAQRDPAKRRARN